MPADKSSLSEGVSESFIELNIAAVALNAVSDELGKAVGAIDEYIKRLNLGIEVWEEISGGFDEDNGSYWAQEIGYAKVAGKWGISLRESEGDDPAELRVQTWPFNEAPRTLRLDGVGKIPALLKNLSDEARQTTRKLQERLEEVRIVAGTLREAARRAVPQRTTTPPLPPEVTQAMGSHKLKAISVDDQGGNK